MHFHTVPPANELSLTDSVLTPHRHPALSMLDNLLSHLHSPQASVCAGRTLDPQACRPFMELLVALFQGLVILRFVLLLVLVTTLMV